MLKLATLWLSLMGLAALAGAASARAGDVVALSTHLSGDAHRTILTIELNRLLNYKVFALDNPYRVVVDLPEVEFRLPKLAGSHGFGVVNDFRYGMVGPGHSRLVITTGVPVLVESAGLLSSDNAGTAQFKIALVATDPQTFTAHLPHRAAKPKVAATDTIDNLVPMPQIANPRRAIPLIVLDPGHGGPDSGAVGPDSADEKNMVLAIGKKARDLLQSGGKFKVLMTRESDVFITLKGRVDFAEQNKADLLVSIHADSTNNSRHWQPVGGATIYTRSETASDEESRLVAMKENMSDQLAGEALPADEGNAVSNIGLDLARTETKALEQVLAEQSVARFSAVMPMTSEPHRSARFYVLKSPEVPAMLAETGYVNNRQDALRLQSAEGQRKLAEAIANAVRAYFTERDKGLATMLGLSLPAPVQ